MDGIERIFVAESNDMPGDIPKEATMKPVGTADPACSEPSSTVSPMPVVIRTCGAIAPRSAAPGSRVIDRDGKARHLIQAIAIW